MFLKSLAIHSTRTGSLAQGKYWKTEGKISTNVTWRHSKEQHPICTSFLNWRLAITEYICIDMPELNSILYRWCWELSNSQQFLPQLQRKIYQLKLIVQSNSINQPWSPPSHFLQAAHATFLKLREHDHCSRILWKSSYSPFSLILAVLGVYSVMLETNCRGAFFPPVVASPLHKNELS